MTLGITLVPLPTHRVGLRGGELAYHDVPPSPSVPRAGTAVFVPGFTGSKEDFSLLAKPVTEAGWRYLAVDQRGQYESVGPDDPAAYTVDALAGELVEFLSRVAEEPAHLVGHSFGGLVARAATIRSPECVASLTLLGSGPQGLSGPRVESMRALAPLLDLHGPERLFDAIMAASPREQSAELVAFLRKRFLASSVTALRTVATEVTTERDRVDELRETGVRLLVAAGEHDDTWLPPVQREMAERLGAPFALIAGAMHSPAAEKPDETAKVLTSFWAGA